MEILAVILSIVASALAIIANFYPLFRRGKPREKKPRDGTQ